MVAASVETWLDDRLGAAGIRRTGPVTRPHERPWATVLRAPTSAGPVWLKAPGPDTVFEVALYGLLGRVAPGAVLTPIAVDVERGWLLLPNGGPVLGDQLDDIGLVDGLVAVLPQYAQLQRELAPHVDELLSFGVADMRPAIMPARFDEAVAVVGERDKVRRVIETRATFDAWCARLGESAVPASIDHNDLHPWNVFWDGRRARCYDWGDAVVAHPFASMLVALGVVRGRLGVGVDDPAITRPRDAYLEAWTDLAPRTELVAELELACWVAKAARVLTWARAVRLQGVDQAGEFSDAPYETLCALLAETWADLEHGE